MVFSGCFAFLKIWIKGFFRIGISWFLKGIDFGCPSYLVTAVVLNVTPVFIFFQRMIHVSITTPDICNMEFVISLTL